jgi:hypothetical protein
VGNDGVNWVDFLGLHEGYPKPIGVDVRGDWAFQEEDGTRFSIDSKTLKRRYWVEKWAIECNRCTKKNGDFKMDCYILKRGKKEHYFEANDYEKYIKGAKGNQLPDKEGRNGANWPAGEYKIMNDVSGRWGPNTPSITNIDKPGYVMLPDGTIKDECRIHPQRSRSEGCITINENTTKGHDGDKKNDVTNSPHMNLIRNLVIQHKSIKLTIKDIGPCEPESCTDDYSYPTVK